MLYGQHVFNIDISKQKINIYLMFLQKFEERYDF